jgi:hypothetical protein
VCGKQIGELTCATRSSTVSTRAICARCAVVRRSSEITDASDITAPPNDWPSGANLLANLHWSVSLSNFFSENGSGPHQSFYFKILVYIVVV